jgi:hypothetical protein
MYVKFTSKLVFTGQVTGLLHWLLLSINDIFGMTLRENRFTVSNALTSCVTKNNSYLLPSLSKA